MSQKLDIVRSMLVRMAIESVLLTNNEQLYLGFAYHSQGSKILINLKNKV